MENYNALALVGLVFIDAVAAMMAYLNSTQLKLGFLKFTAIALILETARQVLNITYISLSIGDEDYFSPVLLELTNFCFFASSFFLMLAILKITESKLIAVVWRIIPVFILIRIYLWFVYKEIDQFSWYLAYLPILTCNAIIVWHARILVTPLFRRDSALITMASLIFLLRLAQPYFSSGSDLAWFGLIYFFDSLIFPAIGVLLIVRALEMLIFRYKQSRENEIESEKNIE